MKKERKKERGKEGEVRRGKGNERKIREGKERVKEKERRGKERKRGKEWKKEKEEEKEEEVKGRKGKGREAGTFCVQQSLILTGPRDPPASTPSIPCGNILGSRS